MGNVMNLLLICDHDPESNIIGAIRVRKFAESLSVGGCSVKVLSRAGVTSYRHGVQSAESLVPQTQVETPHGVRVRRARSTEPKRRGARTPDRAMHLWSKVRPKLTWIFRHMIAVPDREIFSLGTLLRHSRDLDGWAPQVVVVSGPPFSTLFVARRIARQRGIPWVADYRDLWTLSSYYVLGPVRRRLDRALESRLVRSAALVTTTSQPLADEMRSTFGVRSEVVLNGYDPSDLAPLAPVSKERSADPLRIVYAGEIYEGKRDPEPLFTALASMGLGPDQVLVEFRGDTVHLVEAAARRHGVEGLVRCGPRLPYTESLVLQQEADVLLLLMWNNPGERGVYSGKLFEYLGVRRPILMLGFPGSVAADLIRNRDAGVIANDPDDIAAAVRRWLVLKQETGVVPLLPETVSAGLTRQEQSERLRQLCETLIGDNGLGMVT
jgi:glycosyltransferase involved in cell wall biosynthesis